MRLVNYALHFSRTLLRDQRTITQDADIFWEDQNFIKFPSKIVRFCHFYEKWYFNPIFLFRYFEVFKIDFNIMWKSEKWMKRLLPFGAH